MKQILSGLLILVAISCQSQQTLVLKQAPLAMLTTTNPEVLSWNQAQPSFGRLSEKERLFYYWVNYSRLHPSSFFDSVVSPMVKAYPELKGKNYNSLETDLKAVQVLPLFNLNKGLLGMAASHAENITSNNEKPSHTAANGETFDERFKKFNLNSCGGENIGFGGGDTDPVLLLVLLYLDINVPDLGHRKALLNPSYINTGIAIRKYANGNTFLVQDFACTQK